MLRNLRYPKSLGTPLLSKLDCLQENIRNLISGTPNIWGGVYHADIYPLKTILSFQTQPWKVNYFSRQICMEIHHSFRPDISQKLMTNQPNKTAQHACKWGIPKAGCDTTWEELYFHYSYFNSIHFVFIVS